MPENLSTEFNIVVKTVFGLEQVLADELELLGAKNIEKLNRAVSCTGDMRLLYKANLSLRTALKVLKPIHTFEASSNEDFYKGIQQINWSDWLKPTDTLAVDSVVSSDFFNHSQFISQKTKDAIVDQIRDKHGERPSVDLQDPTVKINIRIKGEACDVSIDSSGESLFKRGFRTVQHLAPLNEVLAAGMVLLSKWDGKTTFVDPMCGGGTILAEALLIAQNIPPCLHRERFGFHSWNDFDPMIFQSVVDELRAGILEDADFHIYGSDVSDRSIDITRENLKNIPGGSKVKLSVKDFERLEPPVGPGVAIMNPPYGERLEKADINAFYGMIGSRMKHFFQGYNVWILSSNVAALKNVGLRPSEKHNLFNGQLECKFQKFSIYEGSKKMSKQTEEAR